MCNPNDDSPDGYCEKFNLYFKLQRLITAHTTQDQYDVSYVRVQYIENLMKELEECSSGMN